MKNFYEEINSEFLKGVDLNSDEFSDSPLVNISALKSPKDMKQIYEIIDKPSYKYLNEKEINILKKFNKSIIEYNDNSNLDYIKKNLFKIFDQSNEEILAFCLRNQISGLFSIDLFLNNKKQYLHIVQGINNIGNMDMLKDATFLKLYKDTIKKVFNTLDYDIKEDQIDDIIQYEIDLNKNKLSNSERRNISEIFNKYKLDDIKFKNFDFTKLINSFVEKQTEVYIDCKMPNKYYNLLDRSLIEPNFKYYLIWCLLISSSSILLGSLYDTLFELIKKLKGVKKQPKSKKKIYNLNNRFLGHLISKEYFINIDPTTKPNIKQYIAYAKDSFRERLKNNTWMDEITKKAALAKLNNMEEDVYDSTLIDYNGLPDLTNIYFENIMIITKFLFENKMKELNNKKDTFGGNVYNINAYYVSDYNKLILPYGILREPYYYNESLKTDHSKINWAKIAYNFGAIGSVIGHEIIHGFDDQGRKFDKDGNLNNWWDKKSEEEYNKLTEKLGELYEEQGINPSLTMGENIADIGGVRIALTALILFFKNNGKELDDKLLKYFVKGWAMIWRSKIRKEERKNRLLNDPHSPSEFRVNNALNNLKELNPNNRNIIEIW